MTPVQKTIAYSAIVIGGLAIGMAIGSSVHIAYYVFTSSGINPSLLGGWRKVENICWFPTCCTLGHIYNLCILGPQKISKFSL